MPNHKSCEKRLRQEKKRTARNHYVKKTIKTLSKKMHDENIPIEEKEELLNQVYSKLDKAAKRNVIHKRTASRRKSRLSAYFNKIKAEQAAAEK
ncbi:MAG TPA: 30S ribosomal protein S20 [Candidatus Cloacimonas sp.]|jgi:small subunit ribosomal protein S20|nr:small subunit ribosomal protein [Candidatus Cloacimonadota bacterium]HCX73502.1 30S ribosomal protein S20 [Candidatus Cloacimonas sp.]